MKVLLLERVKNIVTKGDIVRFDQFLLLPSAAEASESFYMRESVKALNPLINPFSERMPGR